MCWAPSGSFWAIKPEINSRAHNVHIHILYLNYLPRFSAKAMSAALRREAFPHSLLGSLWQTRIIQFLIQFVFLNPVQWMLNSYFINLYSYLYYFFPTLLWVYSVLFLTNWKQRPNCFSSNINLRLWISL